MQRQIRSQARVMLAVPALWLGASCAPTQVTRVFNGSPTPGREIAPNAYAHAFKAAIFRAEGNLEGACRELSKAIKADPSAELLTQLGTVRCQLHRDDADQAFDDAARVDSSYPALLVARAQCALTRNRPELALEWVNLAERQEPLLADLIEVKREALTHLHRESDANRISREWLVRNPVAGPSQAHEFDLTQALLEGQAQATSALRWATQRRIPLEQLAIEAAWVGQYEMALTWGMEVLDANPSNGDARAVALVSAYYLRNQGALNGALRGPSPQAPPEPISPSARRLLDRLLVTISSPR